MLLIHLPWKCFSSSKKYSLLKQTLDKEFERKNVSPVIHSTAKIYSLELKQIQEGNFSKIAKEKARKKILKIKVQYWRYSFISRLPCWQIAPVLPSFQQPHALVPLYSPNLA